MNVNANGILLHIGPIVDDRLKEKFRKPSKGILSVHFRVCVGYSATDHSSLRKLIFWLNDPWKMRKKAFFLVFRKFNFYAFN